ncbi:MAG: prolipoprotein diacylglyceryl transferase family protein [Anaerolineae bacterium]
MYPILGRYGRFFLYSYTVTMGLGIAAGLWLTHRLARREPHADWPDGALASLAAGLLGGRLGFVMGQWTYFQERPGEVWQLWRGGLSYHGALLAGLLGLWLWRRQKKRPFTAYADLLAPGLALATSFGWLACWLDRCAFGRQTTLGLFAAGLPDNYGLFAVRYQTQMLGLTLSLLVLLLVLWRRPRARAGALFGWTLLGLSTGHALVSLWRGDVVPLVGPVRIDTILDLALAITALMWLQYTRVMIRR